MTPLNLVPRRDPVLHQRAAEVDRFEPATAQVLQHMSQTMRQSGGIGLAGPQVGIPYRLIVVNAGGGEHQLANPRIVERHGRRLSLEGCLSVPGVMSVVWRSKRVTVEAQKPSGEAVTIQARGLESRCLQHEIDHLDGKLITDLEVFRVRPGAVGVGMIGACVGGAVGGWAGAAIGAVGGYALTAGISRLASG
jgi:peptide deformylase